MMNGWDVRFQGYIMSHTTVLLCMAAGLIELGVDLCLLPFRNEWRSQLWFWHEESGPFNRLVSCRNNLSQSLIIPARTEAHAIQNSKNVSCVGTLQHLLQLTADDYESLIKQSWDKRAAQNGDLYLWSMVQCSADAQKFKTDVQNCTMRLYECGQQIYWDNMQQLYLGHDTLFVEHEGSLDEASKQWMKELYLRQIIACVAGFNPLPCIHTRRLPRKPFQVLLNRRSKVQQRRLASSKILQSPAQEALESPAEDPKLEEEHVELSHISLGAPQNSYVLQLGVKSAALKQRHKEARERAQDKVREREQREKLKERPPQPEEGEGASDTENSQGGAGENGGDAAEEEEKNDLDDFLNDASKDTKEHSDERMAKEMEARKRAAAAREAEKKKMQQEHEQLLASIRERKRKEGGAQRIMPALKRKAAEGQYAKTVKAGKLLQTVTRRHMIHTAYQKLMQTEDQEKKILEEAMESQHLNEDEKDAFREAFESETRERIHEFVEQYSEEEWQALKERQALAHAELVAEEYVDDALNHEVSKHAFEDVIQLVMDITQVNRTEALEALEANNNDPADAVLELDKKHQQGYWSKKEPEETEQADEEQADAKNSWCRVLAEKVSAGTWYQTYKEVRAKDKMWLDAARHKQFVRTSRTSHALLFCLDNILFAVGPGQGSMQPVDDIEVVFGARNETEQQTLTTRIMDCVVRLLTTKTTHVSLDMLPEYYMDRMRNSLLLLKFNDKLKKKWGALTQKVMACYFTNLDQQLFFDNTMLHDFIDLQTPDGDKSVQNAVTHMWNVLNDPAQKFSGLDESVAYIDRGRDYPVMDLLSYVFDVNIRTAFEGKIGSFGLNARCSRFVFFSYDNNMPRADMLTTTGSWYKVFGEATADQWWDKYCRDISFATTGLFENEEEWWSSTDEQGNQIMCNDKGSHDLLIVLDNILYTPQLSDASDDVHINPLPDDVKYHCIQELLLRDTQYTAISMPTHYRRSLTDQVDQMRKGDNRYSQLFNLFFNFLDNSAYDYVAHMWNVLNDAL